MESKMDASKFRNDFRDQLDRVEHDGEHITLERWKRPVAVVVPAEWYRRAQAALGEPDNSN
jgi:prevent-host-death family protein